MLLAMGQIKTTKILNKKVTKNQAKAQGLPLLMYGQPNKQTRVCSRWGAAHYGAVLAVDQISILE